LTAGIQPELLDVDNSKFTIETFTVFNQITVTEPTTDSHLFNALLDLHYTIHIHNNTIILNQPRHSKSSKSQYMHRKRCKQRQFISKEEICQSWKSTAPAVKRGYDAYKKHATWRSWIIRQFKTDTLQIHKPKPKPL